MSDLVTIYRELDSDVLGEEAQAYLEEYEGDSQFVLHEYPRSLEWTQEIVEATVAFHLVNNNDDSILASFPITNYPTAVDAMTAAEKAAASASVKLDILVPRDADEDEAPVLSSDIRVEPSAVGA